MKKKSSFNYDLGFFFLVAVIAVSLSAFVREMNIVLSNINDDNQAAQALLSTTTTTNTPRFADDVSALGACSNKSVRENLDCVKSDFNGDGYVNFGDLAILNASLKYDLNNDRVLTFTNDISDILVLKDCFLDSVRSKPSCARADLDKDGYVNFSDSQRLKSAFTYDLNKDKRVGGTATDADLAVFKTCFGLAASSSAVCILADFNKDRSVNFLDLQLFQSATTNVDYDIDRNGVVEVTPKGSDLSYFKFCVFENPNIEISCKKSDFNNDNFVNFVDLGLLKSATLYDLNGDGKVSYGSVVAPPAIPENADEETKIRSATGITSPGVTISGRMQDIIVGNYQAGEYIKGLLDFNGDGKLDTIDVRLAERAQKGELSWAVLVAQRDNPLVRVMGQGATATLLSDIIRGASTMTLTEAQKKMLDFNGDGKLSSTDATLAFNAEKGSLAWIHLINTRDNPLAKIVGPGTTSLTLKNISLGNLPEISLTEAQKKMLDFNGDGKFDGIDGVFANRAELDLFRWMDLIKQREMSTNSFQSTGVSSPTPSVTPSSPTPTPVAPTVPSRPSGK